MAKTWAKVWGWIFLILGIIGFISNPLIGANGFFHADMMHNIVDLIIGAVLIWASAGMATKAAAALKWVGIILLILAILGFVLVGSSTGTLLGIVEVNGADNWLHLILGIIFVWAAMKKGGMKTM